MATITSTSTRITISGTYKDFTCDTGSTSTVIQYSSGDAPASGDAGRFLMWKNGSVTGNWEIRFIESATATSVTITDGGFSSAPSSGDSFAISTNLDDLNSATSNSVMRKQGRSFHMRGRDFELTSNAFLADVNCSLVTSATQTGSGFIRTYPLANNCALQFGRLIGGEANDSTETIGGCQIIFEAANNTLIFTNKSSANTAGPIINFYGCLIESFNNGFDMFIRSSGAMRLIGSVCDGPMGGRLYNSASELISDRFSGNTNGGIAWSLGGVFTRPIDDAFFFQGNTAVKAFQNFTGIFTNVTFADSITNIIDSSGANSGLLFTFIDCTTFTDSKITNTKGNYKQAKSINYTLTDTSGSALAGSKVAIYDNTGIIQDSIKTSSSSGLVDTINAVFFDRTHGNTSINKTPFDIRIRKYGYQYQGFQSSVSEPIKQEFRIPVNNELVSTEAQAAAISGISINFSTSTLTITSNTTTQELYDYYQYQLAQTAQMPYGEDLIRTGDFFNIDDWDLVLDGCTYTGSITTTGSATFLNNAILVGTITDSSGTTTRTELNLTGLQANTEIRVYDAGTTTELAGVENSGTSFTTTLVQPSVDIVVLSLGYEYQKLKNVNTSQNLTLPIQQRVDRSFSNP
tara:strand:- start:13336 stop:15228 length:1893 start_codon:yes stop_codon:yes gene_type:complete